MTLQGAAYTKHEVHMGLGAHIHDSVLRYLHTCLEHFQPCLWMVGKAGDPTGCPMEVNAALVYGQGMHGG